MSETDSLRRAGGLLRGLRLYLDSDDRRVLGMIGVWIAAVIVGAISLALAAGLAVRVFTVVAGV